MEEATLCIIDVVSLHWNIPREENLVSHKRFSEARTEKKVIIETLVELVEADLKSNIIRLTQETFTATSI